jgi:hypothetical protein
VAPVGTVSENAVMAVRRQHSRHLFKMGVQVTEAPAEILVGVEERELIAKTIPARRVYEQAFDFGGADAAPGFGGMFASCPLLSAPTACGIYPDRATGIS